MNADVISATAVEDKAMLALQEKLDRLLAKAKPAKRELTQQYFRDLYPRLEVHLASGKLLKDVLAAFNELTQAKVCARTFNEMLDQERARRDDAGNPVCCAACGQPLKAFRPKVSDSLSESADFPLTDTE
ncbi:hypothetical protein [Xanthomonas campestris]|uniref:Uncharacterized protein n=1 Tax=Xanthomonas campestris pv. papavericola TaxID=487881 RepID=A0AAJ2X0W6_XANCA|nr:hypothetical protein [Xanthomonas campestris]MEC3887141.1 hypothetical protein [Xanthomonas campestris pv. papavericola]